MDIIRSNQDDFLLSLEGHLLTSLHPVAPDPRFITTLKRRLVSNDPPILERDEHIKPAVDCFGLALWSSNTFVR